MRKFVWEVLLQAKVIRERPWPGLAHAFVFWGFCAFALVTINHVSEAFGWGSCGLGVFYLGFAAVFAVAVAVSIVGLAARRFIVRPKWLGEVSYESGLIAFLIFALMATYLAQFGLAEGSASARANWWLHSLALLIFLPVIPRTKHFHLVLSPITVFLDRRGFSQIPPLEGDEDFGLIAGKDVTRITSLQALHLRRMRALHRALSREPYRQDSRPEGNRPRHAPLFGGIRAAGQPSLSWASTCPWRRHFNAPPAARVNTSARWESSTCR